MRNRFKEAPVFDGHKSIRIILTALWVDRNRKWRVLDPANLERRKITSSNFPENSGDTDIYNELRLFARYTDNLFLPFYSLKKTEKNA